MQKRIVFFVLFVLLVVFTAWFFYFRVRTCVYWSGSACLFTDQGICIPREIVTVNSSDTTQIPPVIPDAAHSYKFPESVTVRHTPTTDEYGLTSAVWEWQGTLPREDFINIFKLIQKANYEGKVMGVLMVDTESTPPVGSMSFYFQDAKASVDYRQSTALGPQLRTSIITGIDNQPESPIRKCAPIFELVPSNVG